MNRRKLSIVLLLFVIVQFAHGQVNRYMVFFADKNGSSFSTDAPEAFLSERAIDRRARYGIAVNQDDLPVNASYVQQVRDAGASTYFTTKWMNGVLVEMDESLISTIEGLSIVSRVEYVAPGTLLGTPTDPIIPETFLAPSGSATTKTQNEMIGADKLHAQGVKGQNMMIAVFDSGFEGVNVYSPFEHIFQEGRMVMTRDFVENSGNVYNDEDHGTRAFSCIAASYNETFVGTAPAAQFILAVTEAPAGEYRIEEYNWLFAAEMADSAGVDVISSSLGYSYGFSDSSMDYLVEDMDGSTTVISQTANMAAERGILVVTSAGNEGSTSWQIVTGPADSPNVLAVGAVDDMGVRSFFSSKGPTADGRIKPDVAALGTLTSVVRGGGALTTSSGTSFSGPVMAGMVACYWQANIELDNLQLIAAIRELGNQASNPDNDLGYGIPNYDLLLAAGNAVRAKPTAYPNPTTETWTIRTDLSRGRFALYDASGKLILNGMTEPSGDVIIKGNLRPGAYYLHLYAEQNAEVLKLIKK